MSASSSLPAERGRLVYASGPAGTIVTQADGTVLLTLGAVRDSRPHPTRYNVIMFGMRVTAADEMIPDGAVHLGVVAYEILSWDPKTGLHLAKRVSGEVDWPSASELRDRAFRALERALVATDMPLNDIAKLLLELARRAAPVDRWGWRHDFTEVTWCDTYRDECGCASGEQVRATHGASVTVMYQTLLALPPTQVHPS